MPSFKDNLGREWTIEITTHEVRRLRIELSIDILSVFEQDSRLFQNLANDPVLLVDCLSLLLTESIKARGLDERQFAQGLVGDGLQHAIDCLVEAIALFSQPHQRGMIKTIWEETKQLQTKMARRVIEEAPKLAAIAEDQFAERLERLKTSSSSTPES